MHLTNGCVLFVVLSLSCVLKLSLFWLLDGSKRHLWASERSLCSETPGSGRWLAHCNKWIDFTPDQGCALRHGHEGMNLTKPIHKVALE